MKHLSHPFSALMAAIVLAMTLASCKEGLSGSIDGKDNPNDNPGPVTPVDSFNGLDKSTFDGLYYNPTTETVEITSGGLLTADNQLPVGVSSSGLVAFYSFNQPNLDHLDSVPEYSANAATADLITNDATNKSIAGPVGQALEFDGIDDYLSIGNPAQLQITTAISVSSWVRSDANQNQYLVTKGNYSTDRGFDLNLNPGTTYSTINFRVFNSLCNSTESAAASSEELENGKWYHVVGVFEPNNSVRLYINGALVASDLVSISGTHCDPTINVNLGTPNLEGGNYFDGALDEVMIFDRVLSDAEIAILSGRSGGFESPVFDAMAPVTWTETEIQTSIPVNLELPPNSANETIYSSNNASFMSTGATAHNIVQLTFEESSLDSLSGANDFADSSGSGFYANETGGVLPGESGKYGSAIKFDGIDDYVTIANSTVFDNMTELTMMLWINPSQAPGINWGRLINKQGNTAGDVDWALILTNNLTPDFRIVTDSGFYQRSTSETLTTGTWYHLAATWDGSSMKIYVNGATSGSSTSTTGTQLINSGNELAFGAGLQTVPLANRAYAGHMDSVHVFNKALSAAEIQTVYERSRMNYRFQVRTCDLSDCSDGSYTGPDFTSGTWYDNSGWTGSGFPVISLSPSLPQSRYLQYQVTTDILSPNHDGFLKNIVIRTD